MRALTHWVTGLPAWLGRNFLLVAAYAVSGAILLSVLMSVAPYEGASFADSELDAATVSGSGVDFLPTGTVVKAMPAVRLRLEVVALDVGEHAVRLQVGALVSPEMLTPTELSVYEGEEAYTDGEMGLPVSIQGYGETFVYRIRRLSPENSNESSKTTYLAYTSGSASRYPFDRYVSTIGVVPPAGLEVLVSVSRSPAWSDPFALAARNITAVFPPETRSREFVAIAVESRRSLSTGLFALLVAASPLFLLVVAWHQMTLSGKQLSRRRTQESVAQALPLELGAAFLALLTLRQVLVPGEISGPTIIDGLLALELSLFVALLVQAWTARTNSPKEST